MSSVESVESTQTVVVEERAGLENEVEEDLLVEDVSIDGMCGVY